MNQDQVEIVLDDEEKTFMVYKELLCFHSDYFRGAFTGSFRESVEKSIRISDVSERVFRLFQTWLYAQVTREEADPATKRHKGDRGVRNPSRNALFHRTLLEGMLNVSGVYSLSNMVDLGFDSRHYYYELFFELSIFADQYDVPQLRRDIMTILVDLEKQLYIRKLCRSFGNLGYGLWSKLPDTAPIRLLMATEIASKWQRDVPEKDWILELPQAIVVDVLHVILTKQRDASRAKALDTAIGWPCDYHEHKNEQERTECESIQAADTPFYVSFLRACMTEVYKIDEHRKEIARSKRHVKESQ